MTEHMKRTLEYIKGVIGIAHGPLAALDKDLKLVSANNSFCKLLDTPFEKLVGRVIFELGDKQFDTQEFRKFAALIREQETIDNYQLTLNGQPASLNAHLLYMENDTEPGIFISLSPGSIQTDKESVDDTYLYLQRIIKLNQAMMSAIPIPVFYKDRQGRYIACNKAFT
ncbi:MAG: PAS domain-containing protein, partial [Elusimicrobiaceae bacterium]